MRTAPKIESSSMLKLSRAVEWTTTSSIERTRATGNPPLAWRSCSLTAEMSWCGSVCVRTSQTTGPMRALSAVMPSVTCAWGTIISGCGSRFQSATVNVANDADDLPGGLIELRSNSLADDDLLADGVLFGPEFLGHSLVDDAPRQVRRPVAVREVAATQNRNLEDLEVPGEAFIQPAPPVVLCPPAARRR